MSASRAYRRRGRRHRLERELADADRAAPRFVARVGDHDEAWMCGRALFVVPALKDDDPPELRQAIGCRRSATLHGRCECCGARRRLRGRGHAVVEHEAECSADDDSIRALMQRRAE